jgi:hypothetical protein
MLECGPRRCNGDVRVWLRPNCAATFAALTIALSVCGCADDTQKWFAKPLNVFGNNLGYSYSSLGEARQDRPISANDLVDANGACPNYAAPQPGAPVNPSEGPPTSPDTASLLGGGIALGMSECDVVSRLGQPTAVNLGKNPNGLRNAILTFNGGPRPGIYRFESGRLSEMDRVEVAPPAPEKKPTKKKPAKTGAPAQTGAKS